MDTTTQETTNRLQDEAIETLMRALDYLCFMIKEHPFEAQESFNYVKWQQKRRRFLERMPLAMVDAA